jgi:hypothetical protein
MRKRQSQITVINLAIVPINEIKYGFADTFYDTLAMYIVLRPRKVELCLHSPICLNAIMLK